MENIYMRGSLMYFFIRLTSHRDTTLYIYIDTHATHMFELFFYANGFLGLL